MSYLKKFSDLVGGIGAFFAAVFLLGKYMEYDQENVEEGYSKLRWFFSSNNDSEYRQYLVLIALMVIAIALGLIFKKYPVISLVASVLPLCQAMSMMYRTLFYDFAYFYVAVCAVMFCGSLYETVAFDRADGRHRTALGATLIGALGVGFSCISISVSSTVARLNEISLGNGLSEVETKLAGDLKPFGILVLSDVPEKEKAALIFFAVAIAVCVIIHLILRRVYFIDAVLAFVPFIWSVSALHAEKIATLPMLVIIPATAYFVCCFTLTFLPQKE